MYLKKGFSKIYNLGTYSHPEKDYNRVCKTKFKLPVHLTFCLAEIYKGFVILSNCMSYGSFGIKCHILTNDAY